MLRTVNSLITIAMLLMLVFKIEMIKNIVTLLNAKPINTLTLCQLENTEYIVPFFKEKRGI